LPDDSNEPNDKGRNSRSHSSKHCKRQSRSYGNVFQYGIAGWHGGSGDAFREAIDALLLLMAPSTPHLAEELWVRSGHPYSIHNQAFPQWDKELAAEEEVALEICQARLLDRTRLEALSQEQHQQISVPRLPTSYY
jgi:leucyl-tRNA synthetase